MLNLTQEQKCRIKMNYNMLDGIGKYLCEFRLLYNKAKENRQKIEYFDIVNTITLVIHPYPDDGNRDPIEFLYIDILINISITYDSYNQVNIKYEKSPIWTPQQLNNNIDKIYEMEKSKELNIIVDQFQDLFDRLISIIYVIAGIESDEERGKILKEYFSEPAKDPATLMDNTVNMINGLIDGAHKQ